MALIDYLKRSIYMNLIYEDRYELILSGLWVTLLLTLVSFVLGTLLGMLFCAGKGSRDRWIRGVCNTITALMVKLPPLVLLMIFAYLILAAYLAAMFVVNRYIKIELLFSAWLG